MKLATHWRRTEIILKYELSRQARILVDFIFGRKSYRKAGWNKTRSLLPFYDCILVAVCKELLILPLTWSFMPSTYIDNCFMSDVSNYDYFFWAIHSSGMTYNSFE